MTKNKKPTKKTAKKHELTGTRVKLQFRKHFLPPLAGLLVFLLVFGFFNSEPLSARIAYEIYARRAENVVYEPESRLPDTPIDKNAPPTVSIEKIGVNAPVIYDQQVVDEDAFQLALQRGVVHYPGTARPGEAGNVVIFGHSSSPWWAKGDYKFVFTLLDKLSVDDLVHLEYEGIRYTYRVNNTFIVDPTDVSVLSQHDDHTLTVITCSPVGSNTERLIVQAVQIAPAIPEATESSAPVELPDNAEGRNLPSSSSGFWQNFIELF